MRMTILELSYKNIRKFHELAIDFTRDGKPYKNSFVMMASGTGKTMTMDLIKGIFDDSAKTWDSTKIKSFRPIGAEAKQGQFSITVLFDEKKFKYFLDLDFINFKASVSTTVASETGGGFEGRRRLPERIKDLFTPQFVKRFVFDGEQAAKVLDNKSNEAEEAIKYLYRLDEFDKILIDNENILAKLQLERKEAGKGTDQSLKNIKTRRDECWEFCLALKKRVIDLESELNIRIDEKKEKEEQIEEINQRFKELNDQRNKVTKNLGEIKGKISDAIKNILEKSKRPCLVSKSFFEIMQELGQNMTRLKLPQTISRQFFKDLADEKYCICGELITNEKKKIILENAENYLGEDQQELLSKIRDSLNNSYESDDLSLEYINLKALLTDETKLKNELFIIEDKLKKAGGERARQLNDEKDNLLRIIATLESEKMQILSREEDDARLNEKNNIVIAEKLFKDYEQKLATITQTNTDLKRKQKFEDYINRIAFLANNKLKENIIRKANVKIKDIISDDFVEIESINKHIVLKEKGGASEGQTLSVAYCYIGTLFEDSELKFPFIIDSPVGKIDLQKRGMIAEILPKLFIQIISFVTSAEVKKFAEKFYMDKDSQFITIESIPNNNLVKMAEGQKYFDKYQNENPEEIKNAL